MTVYEYTVSLESRLVLVVSIVTAVLAPAIVGVELKLNGAALRPVATGTVTEHVTAVPVPEVNVKTTLGEVEADRKSTRLDARHTVVTYAVACVTDNAKVAEG